MKSPIRGKIYSKFEKRARGPKHMGIPVNLLNINLTQSHLRAYLLSAPHLFFETVCKDLIDFKRLPSLELARRNQNSCKINRK